MISFMMDLHFDWPPLIHTRNKQLYFNQLFLDDIFRHKLFQSNNDYYTFKSISDQIVGKIIKNDFYDSDDFVKLVNECMCYFINDWLRQEMHRNGLFLWIEFQKLNCSNAIKYLKKDISNISNDCVLIIEEYLISILPILHNYSWICRRDDPKIILSEKNLWHVWEDNLPTIILDFLFDNPDHRQSEYIQLFSSNSQITPYIPKINRGHRNKKKKMKINSHRNDYNKPHYKNKIHNKQNKTHKNNFDFHRRR